MARDPYETFRSVAMALEAEGIDVHLITDALFTVGMTAANRLSGPEHLTAYLHRMAAIYAAKAVHRAPPPTMTQ